MPPGRGGGQIQDTEARMHRVPHLAILSRWSCCVMPPLRQKLRLGRPRSGSPKTICATEVLASRRRGSSTFSEASIIIASASVAPGPDSRTCFCQPRGSGASSNVRNHAPSHTAAFQAHHAGPGPARGHNHFFRRISRSDPPSQICGHCCRLSASPASSPSSELPARKPADAPLRRWEPCHGGRGAHRSSGA